MWLLALIGVDGWGPSVLREGGANRDVAFLHLSLMKSDEV